MHTMMGVAQRAWAGQALEGQTDPPWPRGASEAGNQLTTRQEEAGSSMAVKPTLMSTPQRAQPLAPGPAVPLNTLGMGHPHPLVPWGSITTWGCLLGLAQGGQASPALPRGSSIS